MLQILTNDCFEGEASLKADNETFLNLDMLCKIHPLLGVWTA